MIDTPHVEPPDGEEIAAEPAMKEMEPLLKVYGALEIIHAQIEQLLADLELSIPENLRTGAVQRAEARMESMLPNPPHRFPTFPVPDRPQA